MTTCVALENTLGVVMLSDRLATKGNHFGTESMTKIIDINNSASAAFTGNLCYVNRAFNLIRSIKQPGFDPTTMLEKINKADCKWSLDCLSYFLFENKESFDSPELKESAYENALNLLWTWLNACIKENDAIMCLEPQDDILSCMIAGTHGIYQISTCNSIIKAPVQAIGSGSQYALGAFACELSVCPRDDVMPFEGHAVHYLNDFSTDELVFKAQLYINAASMYDLATGSSADIRSWKSLELRNWYEHA